MNIRNRFATSGEIDPEKEPDEFDMLSKEHAELFLSESHQTWSRCQCETARKLRAHCEIREPDNAV